MKPITSAALDLLDRVLGLPGGGVQTPQLDDGNVVINVPIAPDIIRRSRTLVGSTGWFYGLIQIPMVDGTETVNFTGLDPYSTGTAVAPWIDPLPEDLEIWLERVCCTVSVGGGAAISVFNRATVYVDPTGDMQAFGATPSGGAIANPRFGIARFDELSTGQNTLLNNAALANGSPFVHVGMRLRRGLTFEVEASAGLGVGETCTVNIVMIIGAFPVSLGSDVAK